MSFIFSNKGWLRRAGRIFFGACLPKGRPYPILIGPLKGARYILGAAPGEGGGGTIYFNQVEPEQSKVFTSLVQRGWVVFDIGANVGYYTLLASRLVGETGLVLACEPLVRNLAYLYQHVKINRINNVIIIPAACAETNSVSLFDFDADPGRGHLTDNINIITKRGRGSIVATIMLDQVISRLEISPNLIKIDVEGAELHVLQGCRRSLVESKPFILLSLHSPQLREDCVNYLRQLGYSLDIIHETYEGCEMLASPS